jgi:hydroxypyruvate reductase
MQELGPIPGVWALAADTDGLDGAGPCAGAIVRPDSHERLLSSGIDADKLLQNNDTLTLLESAGEVIITGPTRTNVNDFRAVLIL